MISNISSVAVRLKELRQVHKVPLRKLAEALGGDKGPSSYQHYEDRFKKPYLPLDVAEKLAPVFGKYGADPVDIMTLAGPVNDQLKDSERTPGYTPKYTDSEVPMSSEAAEILHITNNLSAESRKRLLDQAKIIAYDDLKGGEQLPFAQGQP